MVMDNLSAKETDPLHENEGKSYSTAGPSKDAAGGGGDETLGVFGAGAAWFTNLKEKAGYQLLATLFVTQHLHRGVIDNMSTNSFNYVCRLYHLPATNIQIYEGITRLPWAMKPVIGLLSDILPIFGYNKVPYMTLYSIAGFIGFVCVGVIPTSALPVNMFALCVFLQSLQLSANDLLTEAKYASKISEVPEIGPSILSYVWFGMDVGGLIGMALAGILVAYNPKTPYTVSAILTLAIFVPLICGFMQERRVSPEEFKASLQRFAKESEACILCAVIFAVVVTLTIVGLVCAHPLLNGVMAVLAVIVVGAAVILLLNPTLAKFTVFSMLQSSLTLSTTGAGFYFMTDKRVQYPEGPHFTEFFYTSVIGMVGMVFSMIGVACYQRYLSHWEYRRLFVVANVVYCLVSLLDCIMYSRLNVKLGIPDHFFLMSTTVVQKLIYEWQWMPQVVLLSYLCPPGMEATMYALLAGTHNLGVSVSSAAGSFLLQLLSCQPSGRHDETVEFKNLWIASAIATALPLVTVVVLIKLVPEGRQGEMLMTERSATAGSLWKSWRGLKDEDALEAA